MSITLVRSLGTSTGTNGGATNGGGNIYTLTFPVVPANGNALFFTVFASSAPSSVALGGVGLTQDYADAANSLYYYSAPLVSGSPTSLVVTGSPYTISDVSYDEVTPSGTIAYVGRTAVSAGYNSTHSVPFTVASSDAFVKSNIRFGSSETVSGVTAGWNYGQMYGGASAENVWFFSKQASLAAGATSFGFTIGGNSISGDVLEYSITATGPTVSTVSSASNTEASTIVHTVTLSGATSGSTNFAATLVGVTATGGGTDFTSDLASATYSNGVTFSGGNMVVPDAVSSWTVTISTATDALDEVNETYTLTVGGVSGTGTINDDDAQPSVTISDATEVAGTVTFVATLSAASGKTITFDYATADGTGTSGVDYTGATGTVTFNPGETTKDIVITAL